ncbi:MAG: c-type cytochrome [Gemmatimonadetes bacterium]|nr:c-type cytochrome [Gemmatimonadota bacterium]
MPAQIVRLGAFVFVMAGLAARPAGAQGRFPPDSLINLQVLPKDIATRDLVTMMAGFTRALGIRCSDCHMGEDATPLETYDFASDDKLLKRKAREMIRMLQTINGTHLSSLEERVTPSVEVQCFTCHRGVREPRTLQSVLLQAYDAAGIDSLLAAYQGLRRRYHGRAVFDFGEVPLADIGNTLAGRGRHAEAERVYALNVEMNPSSVFARMAHANALLLVAFARSTTDGRAALSELDTRYGSAVINERLLNSLGYGLLGRRQLQAALEVFRIGVDRFPDSSNAHDSLGEGYAANGQVAEAIRHYERSLELNPQNDNARAKLRELRGR